MSDLLHRSLDHARGRLRSNLLAEGALRTVLVAVGAVAAFFVVDWLAVNRVLALGAGDYAARIVLLAATLGAIGRIAWRGPLREWRTRRSDDQIALRVERRNPALHGRLISTVQLLRGLDGDRPGGSPDMIRALAERTEAEAPAIDFLGIVDRRPLARVAGWTALALAAAAGLAAWKPAHATTLAQRMLLLAVDYPTATRIAALRYEQQVPQGEPCPIELELDPSGSLPEGAQITVRLAAGRTVTLALARAEIADGRALYRGQVPQALDDFVFRPTAGDARWPRWEPVTVIKRPGIAALSLALTYPDYLVMTPETVATGDLRVPEGTRVVVAITATKPMAEAALEIRRDGVAEVHIEPLAIADATGLTGAFTVVGNGAWTVRLRDTDGLSPAAPPVFTMTAIPDQPPVVTIDKPVGDRFVTPVAVWPIEFSVKDDHGIGSATLKYQVDSSDAPGTEVPAVAVPLPGLAGPGELSVSRTTRFEVARLGVQPGQRITWWIEVGDNRTPQPNVGPSQKIRFNVIDLETARAEADRQRADLEERTKLISDRQKEGRDAVKDLLRKVPGR